MPKPKYHIVVCTNARPPGHPKPSCGNQGSGQLLMACNMKLMEKGVMPGEVLVTGSSCLGPCEQGPTVVISPDGHLVSVLHARRAGAHHPGAPGRR